MCRVRSELDMVATSLQRQVDMSAKLTRVYDQRAGGTLTAEGPSGVVQPLPAQVQVYWARLHLAEIIRYLLPVPASEPGSSTLAINTRNVIHR